MNTFDSKDISSSSKNLYLKNLVRLNDNQEIKNLKFLVKPEVILSKLEKYKPNTQRTYLISIVSFLKEDPKNKKLYDRYYKILLQLSNNIKPNNSKTETQKDNFISQDEVLEIYNNLTHEVEPLLNKKTLDNLEYGKILSWVVLSLYTLQQPRRNADYQKCKIIKNYNADLDKEFNYLDISNYIFYFNNYKTSKTYKTQTIPVNDDLKKVLEIYLSQVHPQKKLLKSKKNEDIFLLVNYDGENFKQTNSITRILNSIFKKKIGVSMLRSIYLTKKYAPQIEELSKDAEAMGTSSNMIENHYVKLD
jgi:integrase